MLINNYLCILPIVRNDQTLMSVEGVKNNSIFCIKQTGNKDTGTCTFNVSVLY